MTIDSSGSGNDNRNFMAGMDEHDPRSERMIICPVWICIPHANVIMQILQPSNDLEERDVARDEDSQKVKSAVADVTSHMPNRKFLACSILGRGIAIVSQTAKASIGPKNTA